MSRPLLLIAAATLSVPATAQADLLADLPCLDGKVSNSDLAYGVVSAADVPWRLIDGSNSTLPPRRRDGSVVLDEVHGVLLRRGPDRFGADPGLPASDLAAADLRLDQALDILRTVDASPGERGFTIEGPGPAGPGRFRALFTDPDRTFLRCQTTVAAGAPPAGPAAAGPVRVVLRGRIDDVLAPSTGDRFTDLDPADLALSGDGVSDTRTAALEGVVGLVLDIAKLTPRETPLAAAFFTHWERTESSNEDEDVNVVTPGFQLGGIAWNNYLTSTYELETGYVMDREQRSERLYLRAGAQPSVPIGWPFKTVLFGDYQELGPIRVRPLLDLEAEGSIVTSSGRSVVLESEPDFLGLGGTLGLKARLRNVPALSNLVATFELGYLDFVAGDVELESLLRREVSLIYAPPESENINIELSWVEGENRLTFQEEDYWKLAFGLKF